MCSIFEAGSLPINPTVRGSDMGIYGFSSKRETQAERVQTSSWALGWLHYIYAEIILKHKIFSFWQETGAALL